ncbi:MAG: N-acetylmuramoyl-L-alanine amidase [Rhodobacteraceae bacterium]|nr:N-acetylmuramoyl-L-alanine amidase [Paracoccaceae bacterium]
MRIVALAVWLMLGVAGAQAQDFSALARIDPETSRAEDLGRDGVALTLGLSQGVPYRLFTLNDPPRLVVDFREVDWTGLSVDAFHRTDRLVVVRFGTYLPGWSRLVAQLAQPMRVTEAEMRVGADAGPARLRLALAPIDAESFAATAGAPRDPNWDLPPRAQVQAPVVRDPQAALVVVLDPGHGGIDPGAQQGGVDEKDLMLTFARELREELLRSGDYVVVLTREDDRFVSLERRIALAHEAGADVFLSLHADSLAEGQAHGATVHLLSERASDVASEKLAERHARDDLLSGVDLTDADDAITGVLLDLARQETRPRTRALARALVDGMAQTGGPMNRRPIRAAAFSVLKAADIPSVLIEIGFMSSPRDFRNLRDAQWRRGMAAGIRAGLQNWQRDDAALRPLVRQ